MPFSQDSAETLALTILGWLAANDDLLPVFQGATGASDADLRAVSKRSRFSGAVLDFVMMDDAWVVQACDAAQVKYDSLDAGTASLAGRGTGELDMTMIKGVLFQDGRSSTSPRPGKPGPPLLARLGGSPERARSLGAAIGFDTDARRFARDSIVIAGTAGEVADALVAHIPSIPHDAILRLINEATEKAPQMEAVPSLPYLTALRTQGFALGVATNDAEAPARAHLDSAGVTGCFEFIAGYDSGHGAKPGPGQMLAFAEAVGLDPGAVVMVGQHP